MIIATVCMMRNEEIMAESAIRHWLGFSDVVIVYNHNSTDGTPDILDALKGEFGERLRLFEPAFPVGLEKIQKRITNDMIRSAVVDCRADLVLPLDTDEFPFVSDREKGSIRDLLESLDSNCCYRIDRIPYVLARDGDLDTSRLLPLSFTQTKKPLLMQSPKAIVAGNAYRADPVCVVMGNHSLFRPSGKELPPIVNVSPALFLAHYPYHGLEHFLTKTAIEWLASYCAPEWQPGVSFHIQRCLERLLAGEKISDEYVKWAVLSDFWKTDEGISDIQLQTVDPLEFFPDIPLPYTNRYARKKGPFIQLLEQSLRLADQFKTQQKELDAQNKLARQKEIAWQTELKRQRESEQRKEAEWQRKFAQQQESAREKDVAWKTELERQRRTFSDALATQSRQLAVIRSSLSYRLGRCLTWVPRKLYDGMHHRRGSASR